jgi:hypothetical protein
VYQNKIYVLSPLIILFNKERDPLFDNLSVDLLFWSLFYFPVFTLPPSKRLAAWFRFGPEALGGLAFPI